MLDYRDTRNGFKSMNKLILIGNGFDLALGLKTSYNDFLYWYLKDLLKSSVKKNKTLNNFDGTSLKFNYYKDKVSITYWSINHKQEELLSYITKWKTLNKLQELIRQKRSFVITFDSILFREIYESSTNGWIDIETIYYKLLTENLGRDEFVEKLNKDLTFIKQKLEEYLNTLSLEKILANEDRRLFVEQFHEGIFSNDVIGVDDNEFISHEDTYCLNFNYTDSVKKIIESVPTKLPLPYVNQIHGALNSENEKIIFGFGDEMDKDYNKIEELNDNKYLEHIKSFNYFKNKNYRHLLSYLDSRDYQVCIYGHSCGLSDRVMLNEIFEHENCKSIKIYFYEDEDGGNDFTDKTMEISRHFKSNQGMRSKIVEYNPENKIPQLE